jgi:hypothetical protein
MFYDDKKGNETGIWQQFVKGQAQRCFLSLFRKDQGEK